MILTSYVDPLKHTSMYDRGDEGRKEPFKDKLIVHLLFIN